jgi:hypothetical protein
VRARPRAGADAFFGPVAAGVGQGPLRAGRPMLSHQIRAATREVADLSRIEGWHPQRRAARLGGFAAPPGREFGDRLLNHIRTAAGRGGAQRAVCAKMMSPPKMLWPRAEDAVRLLLASL